MGMFWLDEPKQERIKVDKPKRTPPEPTWLSPDYLPGLAVAKRMAVHVMTDDEMFAACAAKEQLMFDIECYSNYFLAGFTSLQTGKVIYFEATPDKLLDITRLGWVLHNFTTVGFYSNNYDVPIVALALAGKSCELLKYETEQMIVYEQRPQDVLRKHKVKALVCDHIDLIEVAPLRANLKIYGGRLHTTSMQDLPFHPNTVLSDDQIAIVRWYNLAKDLVSTAFLRTALTEQLQLRESMSKDYGLDLRSKSDSQIAEAVIAHEMTKVTGVRPRRPVIDIGTSYRYQVPHFIKYVSSTMQWVI